MADFNIDDFSGRVLASSDEELMALASINSNDYVSEAIELVMAEVERRGLISDLQKVHFDVFLNTSGFAGRLILLDEQVMFLSTGLAAFAGGKGGLAGLLRDAQAAERHLAAKRLDFSSLDNEGSWIYYLDEILKCSTERSLLGGKKLLFDVTEQDGSIMNGFVDCSGFSTAEFLDLEAKVNAAMAEFKASDPENAQ